MRNRRPVALGGGGLAMVLALVVAGAYATAGPASGAEADAEAKSACRGSAPGAAEESPRGHCCFAHPAYAGVCVVDKAKDETCASILAYLNNEQSVGRSYCNRTNVRGGWRQVRCPDEAPPESEPEDR